MSSISSPVTVTAPGFTGTSKFATSLQSVLSRAVGIAALPLASLNAGLTTLNGRQSALQGLDGIFSNLQSTVSSFQSTLDSGLLNSSVSDGTIVRANVQAGATAGDYSIEVTDLGSSSTALSAAGSTAVSDPATQGLTSAPSVKLQIGTVSTTITPASATLKDLAAAINSQAGGQVQATLVNIGSTASPDYRLSLRSAKLGTDAVGLTDSNGTNLIASAAAGSLATYKIDGAAAISSDTRTITLSPGVTLNLLGKSTAGQATTVSVANNATGIASAFVSFAAAYNSAVDGVASQRGQGTAPLQGDSLLLSLSAVLSHLGTYSNGPAASALANFGIELDKSGHLSVDTVKFGAAASADLPALLSTLGSATGGGFLKSATDLLNGVQDLTTGTLKNEESSVANEIVVQNTRISAEQATVTQLQSNLTAQIARADAAIASLESQVSYITGLFASFTGANSTQSNGLSTL